MRLFDEILSRDILREREDLRERFVNLFSTENIYKSKIELDRVTQAVYVPNPKKSIAFG